MSLLEEEIDAPEEYEILFEGDEEPMAYPGKDGRARASYPNGDVYVGPYVGGKKHGSDGSYLYSGLRALYTGDWVENVREGQGTMVYPDKSKYVGAWVANERNGFGTYFYANGDRYCGEWKEGHKAGQGSYVFADGSQLCGEWQDDVLVKGQWRSHDGTVFDGDFENSRPAGPGVLAHAHGLKQRGKFVHDKFFGDLSALENKAE